MRGQFPTRLAETAEIDNPPDACSPRLLAKVVRGPAVLFLEIAL